MPVGCGLLLYNSYSDRGLSKLYSSAKSIMTAAVSHNVCHKIDSSINRGKLVSHLQIAGLVTLSLAFSNCFSYGLIEQFDNGGIHAEAYLPYAVLRRHAIKFCVHNTKPDRFLTRSIEIQTETGLRLWLSAVKSTSGSVAIATVECTAPDCDLIVDISDYRDNSHKNVPTFEAAIDFKGRTIAAVAINTAFKGPGIDGLIYSVVDFVIATTNGVSGLPDLLNSVSVGPSRTNLEDFAKATSNPYDGVYFSSYHSILHELGHAFGLCDTNTKSLSFHQCSQSSFSGQVGRSQPDSIMKTSNYFYLTDDDVAGVQAALRKASSEIDRARVAQNNPGMAAKGMETIRGAGCAQP
jgi:hypothetical protein